MLLDEGVDVADALLLEDLLDGDEDAGLLDVAEAVVDGGAEELHRGREAHIGIDQRRDVVTQLTDLGVEDALVFLEIGLAEECLEFLRVGLDLQRFHRHDEVLLVGEVLVEEV